MRKPKSKSKPKRKQDTLVGTTFAQYLSDITSRNVDVFFLTANVSSKASGQLLEVGPDYLVLGAVGGVLGSTAAIPLAGIAYVLYQL